MSFKKILFFIIFFISFFFSAFSQADSLGIRITVFKGSKVDFIYNSLSNYLYGFEYSEWTGIRINFTDRVGGLDNPLTQGWKLTVEPTADKIYSDGTANLPLSTLKILAVLDPVGTSVSSEVTLNIGEQDLLLDEDPVFDGNGNLEKIIYVTYKCSKGVSIIGSTSDYYNVHLVFYAHSIE